MPCYKGVRVWRSDDNIEKKTPSLEKNTPCREGTPQVTCTWGGPGGVSPLLSPRFPKYQCFVFILPRLATFYRFYLCRPCLPRFLTFSCFLLPSSRLTTFCSLLSDGDVCFVVFFVLINRSQRKRQLWCYRWCLCKHKATF